MAGMEDIVGGPSGPSGPVGPEGPPTEDSLVAAYLQQHETKGLLRFITCGSVDDGKSTLIGRLLHDTKLLLDDQIAALERDSRKFGTVADGVDLALLVDGLEAEREQGITIDVAYRFFATAKCRHRNRCASARWAAIR